MKYYSSIDQDTVLNFILQDHLGSTAAMADEQGNLTGTVPYTPFGRACRFDGIATDRRFTGQRLDSTGLYYYGARYYDPRIGSFISPDTIVPDPANPQSFNRYSYCYNNPLSYTDPTGNWPEWLDPWVRWGQQQLYNVANTLSDTWNTIQPVAMPAMEVAATVSAIVVCLKGNTGPISQRASTAVTIEQRVANVFNRVGARISSFSRNALPRLGSRGVAAAEKVASKSLIPYYPVNGGALGAWEKVKLSPGSLIDRYGFSSGTYASPVGVPKAMRSLSPAAQNRPLFTYEVIKALEVDKSITMPWFGQFGYGIQYHLPDKVENLLKSGYIRQIP